MSTISERIRELRKEKGLSQSEVAKYLGVNRTTYVHYETGYSKPTQKLKQLCELFNTTADYIMGTNIKKEPGNIIPGISLKNNIELSADEEELIKKYRQLSEKDKGKIEGRIDTLLEYDESEIEEA